MNTRMPPPLKEICCICQRSSTLEDIILYPLPKTKSRLSKWSKACDKKLREGAMVCEFHFTEADFRFEREERVLRRLAVPSVDLHNAGGCEINQESESVEVMPDVAIEPLASNLEEIALEAAPAPTEFINEDLFDNNTSSPNPLAKSAPESAENSLTCGLIKVTLDDEVFSINCTRCEEEYELTSLNEFIEHVKHSHDVLQATAVHLKEPTKNGSHVEELVKEVNTDCVQINNEDSIARRSSSRLWESTAGNIKVNALPLIKINPKMEDCDYSDDNHDTDCSDSPNDLDEGNEPSLHPSSIPVKKDKEVKDAANQSKESGDDSDEDYDVNAEDRCTKMENEIIFNRSEHDLVMDYLNLVKLYPVLWHCRLKAKRNYDNAIKEVSRNLRQKWPKASFTAKSLTLSLTRSKKWFQRRLIGIGGKRIECKRKERIYFDECAQFLTRTMIKDSQETFSCKLCDCVFLENCDLQTHKYLNHNIGELPHPCTQCAERFESARCLKRHMRDTHIKWSDLKYGEKKFNCTECEKSYRKEEQLQSHIKKKHTVKPVASFICEICGKSYTQMGILRKHKRAHEPPRFECSLCSLRFVRAERLREHIKLHYNQRDYACDVCGKTFIRRRNLVQHSRVHKGGTGGKSTLAEQPGMPNTNMADFKMVH